MCDRTLPSRLVSFDNLQVISPCIKITKWLTPTQRGRTNLHVAPALRRREKLSSLIFVYLFTDPSYPSTNWAVLEYPTYFTIISISATTFDTFVVQILSPAANAGNTTAFSAPPANVTGLVGGTEYKFRIILELGSVTDCGLTKAADLVRITNNLTACTRMF